jgi:hypothetical protein
LRRCSNRRCRRSHRRCRFGRLGCSRLGSRRNTGGFFGLAAIFLIAATRLGSGALALFLLATLLFLTTTIFLIAATRIGKNLGAGIALVLGQGALLGPAKAEPNGIGFGFRRLVARGGRGALGLDHGWLGFTRLKATARAALDGLDHDGFRPTMGEALLDDALLHGTLQRKRL